jgi:DNA-directed RNA polymerase specialized sigma24 family protein
MSPANGKAHSTANKITPDQRRAVVLEALEANANNYSEIARRYCVRRTNVYALLDTATRDPKGRLREAEKEVAFRKRVIELLG